MVPHEIDGISYRQVMTEPAAMHFDEWAGIYYILREPGVSLWQENRIFDLSFHQYRTRAEDPAGRDPRRYAWEDGEVCEHQIERGGIVRPTALLVHLHKPTMRTPAADVLAAIRYWISANGFTVQHRVSPWRTRTARIPTGRELLPFYPRRIQRRIQRRAARKTRERSPATQS